MGGVTARRWLFPYTLCISLFLTAPAGAQDRASVTGAPKLRDKFPGKVKNELFIEYTVG